MNIKKLNKRGAEKYYVVISLILGMIILVIAIFWLYQEYFGQDEINRETCRQSIILRGNIPDVSLGGLNILTFKDKFPLKCKTEIVDIKSDKQEDVLREIADTLTSCHYLIGEGLYRLYPNVNIFGGNKVCIVCSRLHFSEDKKDKFPVLDVGNYIIKTKMDSQRTYFDYIYGNRASAMPEQQLKDAVISMSKFDSRKGDIFVVAVYQQGRSITRQGYFTVIQFFQPEVKPDGFSALCDVIETIPA